MSRPDYASIQLGRVDVQIKTTNLRQSKSSGGGRRSTVKELSYQSRLRMMRTARNMPTFPNMLTLTYPSEFPADGKLVKYHWRLFREWLQRQGCTTGFWFLEFQKRGAPHFHVFLPINVCHKSVARRWYEIVDSGDEKHLRAGTRIEALRNSEGAASYASKYATKCEQKEVPVDYQNVGRFWGLWGIKNLFSENSDSWSQDSVHRVARVCRKWAKSQGRTVRRVKNQYSQYMYGVAKPLYFLMKTGKLDFFVDREHKETYKPRYGVLQRQNQAKIKYRGFDKCQQKNRFRPILSWFQKDQKLYVETALLIRKKAHPLPMTSTSKIALLM